MVEFLCALCFEEFEMDWSAGDDVVCPGCGALYETIYEVNAGGHIIGPWLGHILKRPEEEPVD
jgi:hypothetical protein